MFSSKPSPVIKFYINKHHLSTSRDSFALSSLSLRKRNPENVTHYPDYFEDHRSQIILDYQRKLDEINNIKKRLSAHPAHRKQKELRRITTSSDNTSKRV